MIRNPEIQFASADAIAAFQQERLREEIAYLYENSPYYRRMFDGCGMQPGDIRTGFTAARQKNPMGDDVYGGGIARSVAGMEKDEQNGMTPEQAGAFVAHTAMRKSCKPIRTIGLQYKFFHVLSRILPCRLLNWLVGLLYAK